MRGLTIFGVYVYKHIYKELSSVSRYESTVDLLGRHLFCRLLPHLRSSSYRFGVLVLVP